MSPVIGGVKLLQVGDGHLVGFRTNSNVVVKPKKPRREECPKCYGVGMVVIPNERYEDPPCDLCEGRGWVIMHACRNCGRPAYQLSTGGPPLCFRGKCIKALLPKAQRQYERFGASSSYYNPNRRGPGYDNTSGRFLPCEGNYEYD
jgi:hypothetical protein